MCVSDIKGFTVWEVFKGMAGFESQLPALRGKETIQKYEINLLRLLKYVNPGPAKLIFDFACPVH